jgi:hypothetical protein
MGGRDEDQSGRVKKTQREVTKADKRHKKLLKKEAKANQLETKAAGR